MSKEIIWFIAPICGLLSQIGGTWKKQFRRIGIPIVVVATAWYFCGFSWYLPLLFACIFGFCTLPFTLIGKSIKDSWFNWVWIVLYSALMSVVGFSAVLAYGNIKLFFLSSIVSYVIIVPCFVLSNVKATAQLFSWKFVEGLTYFMMVYPICQVLTNS